VVNPAMDVMLASGVKKRGAFASVLHGLEKITKASDLAARMAVYEETINDTKSASNPEGDTALAQLRARELINFSRGGTSQTMNILKHTVPFMNAYAQGMDVLYRNMTGENAAAGVGSKEARQLFYSRMAMMTALGTVYAIAMAGSDDEGYDEAPNYVKDANLLFPGGFKLPLPRELAFVFKVIPERAVTYAKEYGTEEDRGALKALAGLGGSAWNAYAASAPIPPVVAAGLEGFTNHSFFTGRAIVPNYMQKLDASEQVLPTTSELSKTIGGLLDISPLHIDNVLKRITGTAGGAGLMMGDALLNPTRADRPLYQLPLANLFLYDEIGNKRTGEFFELSDEVLKKVNTFNSLEKTDPAKADAYYEKHAAYIDAAPDLNNLMRERTQLRQERDFYTKGSDELVGMNGAQRRVAIDEIRKYENEVVKNIRSIERMVREGR
jgi:hypothetical protein